MEYILEVKLQQLYFEFSIKPTYLAEDFLVSSANVKAFSYLSNWPDWNSENFARTLLIYGEYGAGKTHLAHIWQNNSKARFLKKEDCYNLHLLVSEKSLILEDIEFIDEEILFHLINFAHENKQYLLLTSQISPKAMNIKLADLKSRILSITSIAIEKPDEQLLKAVLLKHLAEQQLKISEQCLDFIVARVNRSFCELSEFIQKLEKTSKVNKKAITIPLVKKILDKSTQN